MKRAPMAPVFYCFVALRLNGINGEFATVFDVLSVVND